MSATTGQQISELAHLQQSVRDILSTPIGSRVMRRDYGSALFALVDAPLDAVLVVDLIQAAAAALARWEPRLTVLRIKVRSGAPGRVILDLDLRYAASGLALQMEGLIISPWEPPSTSPDPDPTPIPVPPPAPALPDASGLPDGAMLQVIGGQWAVELAAGWVSIATLSRTARLPGAGTLPDGAMLQVIGGQWTVETAAGWQPTSSVPAAATLPAAQGWADGSLLQVVGGQWAAVGVLP